MVRVQNVSRGRDWWFSSSFPVLVFVVFGLEELSAAGTESDEVVAVLVVDTTSAFISLISLRSPVPSSFDAPVVEKLSLCWCWDISFSKCDDKLL